MYVCDSIGGQVDCNYVVTSSDAVFARLEHHKSHEYTSRRTPGTGGGGASSSRKRRGRPPKYVTNYEFSDEEIRARAAVDGPTSAIAHGFVRYTGSDQCPDRRCTHRYREHFHCVRARCHDVEVLPAALVAHDRDFHAHFHIAEGFEFFGVDVDCRRARCRARRGTSGPTGLPHFHCVRSGCDYAFVRQSTMVQHEARHRASHKHALMMMSQPSTTSSSRQPVRIIPRQTTTLSLLSTPSYSPIGMPTVRGETLLPSARSTSLFAGPSLPAQVMSTTLAGVPSLLIAGLPTTPITVVAGAVPVTSTSQATVSVITPGAVVRRLVSSTQTPSPVVVAATTEAQSELSRSTTSRPLVRASQPAVVVPQPAEVSLSTSKHHGAGIDCGRPYCQLKRCDHFHCGQCEVAVTDVLLLREHLYRVHHSVTAATLPVIQAPISRETAHLTNSSPTSSSAASDADVRQPAPIRSQFASINAENNDLRGSSNNNAERYSNDKDSDNGGMLVVDLTSSSKGRSSNVEARNVGNETNDLESSLKMTTVGRVENDV